MLKALIRWLVLLWVPTSANTRCGPNGFRHSHSPHGIHDGSRTNKIQGFKNGYVVYGTCAEPGRIVKLKFKYEIPERWFFDELLERFKKKFGQPSEWKGDPFQTLIAWKWSLKDSQRNAISMILQHYSGDDEEFSRGNSLRLTIRSFIDQESRCYEQKYPEPPDEANATPVKLRPEDKNRIDFGHFIPE